MTVNSKARFFLATLFWIAMMLLIVDIAFPVSRKLPILIAAVSFVVMIFILFTVAATLRKISSIRLPSRRSAVLCLGTVS